MSDKPYSEMSDSEKKKEDWMNSKWRPMMGWIYMATCAADFVLFPILWSLLQASLGHPVTQWQPLTLQGAGLYHIAMGAVLGLAAWGRTQEKLNGANNGGLSLPSSGPTTFGSPTTGSFGATTTNNYGGGGFGGSSPMVPRSTTVTTTFGAPAAKPGVMMSSTGKPMPIQPDDEEL